MLEITLPATPSLNEFVKRQWQVEYGWRNLFLAYLKGYERLAPVARMKRRVTYQRHGQNILDYENYVGGTKPLTDALKKKGLIVDDSPKWLDLVFMPQVRCDKRQEKTVVRIEDIA